MAHDAFGGAPNQRVFESCVTVGGNHDEVSAHVARRVDDFLERAAIAHERFAKKVRSQPGLAKDAIQPRFALAHDFIIFYRQRKRLRKIGYTQRFDDMKDIDARAKLLSQGHRILQGLFGRLGKIHRDEDRLDTQPGCRPPGGC